MHAVRRYVASGVHDRSVTGKVAVSEAIVISSRKPGAGGLNGFAALAGRHTRIAKEESLLHSLNVHRPEHGADIRETLKGEVDVRPAHPHKERRHAVRHTV